MAGLGFGIQPRIQARHHGYRGKKEKRKKSQNKILSEWFQDWGDTFRIQLGSSPTREEHIFVFQSKPTNNKHIKEEFSLVSSREWMT